MSSSTSLCVRRIRGALCGLLLGTAFTTAGCDKKLPTLEEAKEAVQQVHVPAVVDNGQVELSAGAPVNVGACYGQLALFQSGIPNVLQLTTYKDAKAESFPSVYLRVVLGPGVAAPAQGQTLQGQLYIQSQQNGPVLHSTADAPVTVNVTAVEGTKVTVSIQGKLFSTDTGAATDVSGSMRGAW